MRVFGTREGVMKITRFLGSLLLAGSILLLSGSVSAEETSTLLVHIKTSLQHNDAQICAAYNVIWAALEEGLDVNVLIDADAVNTFRIGWFGSDHIENRRLPENMRRTLSRQFDVPLDEVPRRYGEYLAMLRDKGAEFYINEEMLITAGIAKGAGDLDRISARFFKPVTLPELVRLRMEADAYLVY